ncbi:MAG: pyridoxal 5'-phosphate synthase glutaminase subunit PdxT [Fervidobacterium sp.]|uniref:Pyridoxal 5'-phosphate synthase subunit PdxT n=1 Tax=Fervidobacterium gondwanense DSM 13020 TaxID=1121883 RepID=A0A1M7RWX4_FERGO|nr:pyridoxal 5'-phosphate synthase glutaminase subunit PdxT [Fervidobacterium gondwanense]UXF00059.1 glutamine amidotransferase [Fervidobacterium riparium]SHN50661.1 pyridoxal phosphate synthase yaaE subunit [Fervidobacterium gondwanense DSM 13020]
MVIGVSGIQGDFREHKWAIEKLGVETYVVRTPEDLEKVDGLIIPGGESTTMIRIMKRIGLFDALKEKILKGFPVYGTCAGLIVLAKEIENYPQESLGVINIKVRRNAYGRQVDSFDEMVEIKGFDRPFKAIFIRAPRVEEWGNEVETLAFLDKHPIMLRQKNVLVTSFHPELTDDTRVHEYFLSMVKEYRK